MMIGSVNVIEVQVVSEPMRAPIGIMWPHKSSQRKFVFPFLCDRGEKEYYINIEEFGIFKCRTKYFAKKLSEKRFNDSEKT